MIERLESPRAAQRGVVEASYDTAEDRTFAARVFERGGLRVRHPHAAACEAVLINTGGGIVAGDRLAIDIGLDKGAVVTVTTAAAEKVYRADRDAAVVTTQLRLGAGSHLSWVPQETIFFDHARLDRSFEIELAEDATLVAAETVVFGRAAHGEHAISGCFRDSWRLRRGGRLAWADETRIEGAMASHLDRAAVAGGARAIAMLLVVRPDAPPLLDRLRTTIATQCAQGATSQVDGAASLRDGIILARFTARSASRLRVAMAAMLDATGGVSVPRTWL